MIGTNPGVEEDVRSSGDAGPCAAVMWTAPPCSVGIEPACISGMTGVGRYNSGYYWCGYRCESGVGLM